MEEKRELVAYLAREYGFQFKNMDGRVPGQGASVGSGGEYHGWTVPPSGEERCLVSLDGWEIPVRDALSDIVAAAERVLQEGGRSFLAELDDGEMMGLMGMVGEEIFGSQYYPYPTVSRGDREFAKYALDLAVLCGRPEEVRQAAWNLQQFVENVGSFGGALRGVYCSPFWIAVTLEPQDITENALPRMAVEAMDDLDGAALGLGGCSVHFPKKICLSFDGTEEGFAERFGDVLESVAGGIWVSGAGEQEACLETARRIFREDSARMVKGFRAYYFEGSHAGEWWHDTLGMDAGEVVSYIKNQDAHSRMGILKEMYRLRTVGGQDGMPSRENLGELAQIGEAFQKDSHQGVAALASRIRDAAGRGIRALGRMETIKGVVWDADRGAEKAGAGLGADAAPVGEARLYGRMPDVDRLDSPVVLEVYPEGKESFHISLEAAPMAYRNSGFAAKWPVLGKIADVLEQREAQAEKRGREKKKGTVER